jgi:hypothetical protein
MCLGGVRIPCQPVTPVVCLFPDMSNGTICSQDQCVKNGLTVGKRHIRHHLLYWKAVFFITIT